MEDIQHCSDGSVCGCPEWWGLGLDPTFATASVNEACASSIPHSTKAANEPDDRMCFFWYHYRVCKRPKWKYPCPYKHQFVLSGTVQTPKGITRHDRPCDLPLCPLRDNVQPANLSTPEGHYDHPDPLREPVNRQRLHSNNQTCFFWYHDGNCARRPCDFHHRVLSSNRIVPPPGYVHRGPCYLPLCPLSEPLFKQKSTVGKHGKSKNALRLQRWREKKKRLKALGGTPSTSVQKPRNSNKRKDLTRPLISLHGRRADSPTIRPSSSPESGELFSDEEPPDEAWFLEGFPDAAPEGEEDRVAQVGDVIEVVKWEVKTPEADGSTGLAKEEAMTEEQACVGGQERAEGVGREVEGDEAGEQAMGNSFYDVLWAAMGGE